MDKITFNIMDEKKTNFHKATLENKTNMTEVLNDFIDEYLANHKENKSLLPNKVKTSKNKN